MRGGERARFFHSEAEDAIETRLKQGFTLIFWDY